MKRIRLLIPIVFLALFVGCNNTDTQTPVNAETEQKTLVDSEIKKLGDQIAGLSNVDAAELSLYLSDVHGIVPAGHTSDSVRKKDSFETRIAELGEKLASLSLAESVSLSDYLAETHEIEGDSDSSDE